MKPYISCHRFHYNLRHVDGLYGHKSAHDFTYQHSLLVLNFADGQTEGFTAGGNVGWEWQDKNRQCKRGKMTSEVDALVSIVWVDGLCEAVQLAAIPYTHSLIVPLYHQVTWDPW